MQSFHRQNSGASYHTSSIARNDNGMSFAAQARAHELHAFRSNKDRHQNIQEPQLNGVDGNHDSNADNMTRRKQWTKLDLGDLSDASPPTESEAESESPASIAQANDQAAPLQCTSPRPPARRRAPSKVAALITATQKRRARSGEFDDLDISLIDADVDRRPSPFPSDQSHLSIQSLHQEYGVHVQAPVVNLPTAAAAPKPPAYYPAVKGTAGDQQRQAQSAEMRAITQATNVQVPALKLTQPSNAIQNSSQTLWDLMASDGFTPDSFGQSRPPSSAQLLTDPFDSQSVASEEMEIRSTARARPQPIMPPSKQARSSSEFHDDPLPSFVRPSLKESEDAKKAMTLSGSEPIIMGPDLDNRFDQASREAVTHEIRASGRSPYSVSMARPSRMSSNGERRPPFGGYVFSDRPDGSFAKTEQDESDEIFHHLLLPVMATLKSYQIGENNYFNPFVKAPEWTIDHSPSGQRSYFGEDWGTPPPRVGRDPRYRPFHDDMRVRDDAAFSGLGGFPMQTPVRASTTRAYRQLQDFSGSSGSSPYSAPRGTRAEEGHVPYYWKAGAGEHIRRMR